MQARQIERGQHCLSIMRGAAHFPLQTADATSDPGFIVPVMVEDPMRCKAISDRLAGELNLRQAA